MSAPPTVPRYDSPVFLIVCRDRADAGADREDHLEGHLAHVEAYWQRYILAGPMRNPGEARLTGSYFLVRAKDEADARALMSGDPYVSSGMYGAMEVFEATPSLGLFMGGKIWADAASLKGRATG